MSKHQLPRRLSRTAFALSAVLLMAFVLGLTSYHLWRLRSQAIESGLQNAAQLASSLEEHLTQTLSLLEVSLIQQGEKSFSPAAAEALTRNAHYIRSINLVDVSGHVVNSSVATNIGSLFDSSTLLPKANGPLAFMRIGPLMNGRDISSAQPVAPDAVAPSQSIIPVQRDLALLSGGFTTMVAALNPDYFLNYYERHLDLAYGEVALMRLDGSLLLSTADRFKPNAHVDTDIMSLLNKSASGSLRQTTLQQQVVLSAYRVSDDFPVLLVVKLNQDRVLEAWLREVRNTLTVVLSILILALISSTVYFLRLGRLRHVNDMRVQDWNNQKYALDQHAIVSITDTTGRITYANERFCALSGYSLEELLGQLHSKVKSGQHSPALYEDLWLTITRGQVWHGELCNRNKDGGLNWVDTTIVPLIGVDGQIQQYIAIRTDITQRKSIEASLVSAKAAAEQANEAKSQFLANMSHEIRTPMNAILGLLNLLQRTELTVRQRDYASKTEDASQSLLGLLNDILDFSKFEAGKMALEMEPLYIDKVLRNLSVVLSANVGAKDIEVLFDVDLTLPSVVRGDAMRLQQVLINLGGNAVKFTSVGQVVLALRKLAQTEHAVTIEFSVQDTGIGIAPEHQEHIFSGFSQAEGSTTRRFGGTGLGLAISQRFVELMGGDIKITSQQGVGSTFAFSLEMPTEAVGVDAWVEVPLPAPQAQHVLVVDDNPIAGMLTMRMVRSLGWTAELAKSGKEAIERLSVQCTTAIAEFPYPVIFMDWLMPGMDGWETTLLVRQFAQKRNLAQPIVIMFTAHGREMLAQRTENGHALINGFLVKPATASMLFDALMDAQSGTAGIRKLTKGRSSTRQLTGMRILVVEDNLINQQVAEELLAMEGAIVSLAANGQLGVDAVAAAAPQFDVVLMDVQMPVLDGYGATRAIREDLHLQALPIIAMTANAMASDRDACLASGMNEHIGKPFDMAELVSLLIRMTGLQPGIQDAPSSAIISSEPAELPVIAGLDLDVAVQRMSGMRSLYVRTAESFAKTLETEVLEIRRDIETGSLEKVKRRLHTFKGNAATLGANALALKAGTLERVCQSPSGLEECAHGLDELGALCQSTKELLLRAVSGLKTENAAPEQLELTPASLEEKLHALHSIAELAAAFDMDVMMRFAHVKATLAGLPIAFRAALDASLHDLDLSAAHDLCKAMIAELES